MNKYTIVGFTLLITVPLVAMKTELHKKAAECYYKLHVEEILSARPGEIGQKDDDGNIPLHEAAYFGCLGNAAVLLNYGSAINERNYKDETPLDKAHYNKHTTLETFLRLKGGEYSIYKELNQRPVSQEDLDNLLWSVHFNYALSRFALEKGANPNAMHDTMGVKMTPLHNIAQSGDYKTEYDIMEVLLEFGADINKKDSAGWTPYGRAGTGADSQTGDHILDFFKDRGAKYEEGALYEDPKPGRGPKSGRGRKPGRPPKPVRVPKPVRAPKKAPKPVRAPRHRK